MGSRDTALTPSSDGRAATVVSAAPPRGRESAATRTPGEAHPSGKVPGEATALAKKPACREAARAALQSTAERWVLHGAEASATLPLKLGHQELHHLHAELHHLQRGGVSHPSHGHPCSLKVGVIANETINHISVSNRVYLGEMIARKAGSRACPNLQATCPG